MWLLQSCFLTQSGAIEAQGPITGALQLTDPTAVTRGQRVLCQVRCPTSPNVLIRFHGETVILCIGQRLSHTMQR